MISVVIITKNEEKNISACLSTVSWCDEIIVVDDNSIDKTIDLAKKTKAKVIMHPLNNDFSAQRNYGLSLAKGEWVLFVDADERVSSALWYEIMLVTNNSINSYTGFYLRRIDFMFGKKLKFGETGRAKFVRLVRKDTGRWIGKVHEEWKAQGQTSTLKNPLQHYPHSSVKNFIREVNQYTDIRALELYNKKVSVHLWAIILFPCVKFLHNYVFRLGFLDGLPGLVFALIMSFHSFLVRGKVWYLWQKQ